MTPENNEVEIYQFHLLLLEISPAIWRRILVPSNTTIASFHSIIQTAVGWEDEHLHRFHHNGRDYGVYHEGGLSFRDNPHKVRLSELKLRIKERFIYEYDFTDNWQLQIRLEQILPFNPKKTYPVCIAGARKAPPEDCGGAWAFLEQEVEQDLALWRTKQQFISLMTGLVPLIMERGRQGISPAQLAEMKELMGKIDAAKFDRKKLNQELALLSAVSPANTKN